MTFCLDSAVVVAVDDDVDVDDKGASVVVVVVVEAAVVADGLVNDVDPNEPPKLKLNGLVSEVVFVVAGVEVSDEPNESGVVAGLEVKLEPKLKPEPLVVPLAVVDIAG